MATCSPGVYPALVMASRISSTASSFDFRPGANPPSSPTAVLYPFFLRTPFRVWKTSTPQRSASAKHSAPTGMTMNSWKSTLESAWLPPFRMFIMGVGSRHAFTPPR